MTTVVADGVRSRWRNRQFRRRTAPPTPPAGQRNRSAVVLGLLLVLASGAVGVALYASATERPRVLAARRDVPAGARISASDLTTARVASDPPVRPIPASARSQVIGRVARVGLVPGAILTPAHLAPKNTVPRGQSVVAVQLQFGQAPALAPGDRVLVVAPAHSLAASAEVFAVDKEENGDDVRVSLLTDEQTAAQIAVAAVSREDISVVRRGTQQ